MIAGYRDAFAKTASVGSFTANRFGLFDLGGNAREWCEDLMERGQQSRVTRGGTFQDSVRGGLLSSSRGSSMPSQRTLGIGFRVVLAPTADPAQAPAAPGTAPAKN